MELFGLMHKSNRLGPSAQHVPLLHLHNNLYNKAPVPKFSVLFASYTVWNTIILISRLYTMFIKNSDIYIRISCIVITNKKSSIKISCGTQRRITPFLPENLPMLIVILMFTRLVILCVVRASNKITS